MPRFSAQDLEQAARRVFRAAGSQDEEADRIARLLVGANLSGHDSHGVGMIPRYVSNIHDGTMVLNGTLKVALDAGGMLICDGGLAAGQSMGHAAMALGIERAQDTGSCIVALRNSHHLGRIGHWAESCAEAGLVSIHFVNVVAEPAVAMFGGTRARLGTNPFAAAFPRAGQPPVLVDFATSRLAVGKIRVAHNSGVQAPPGALLDGQGQPTTDPSVMFEPPTGCLLPFGEHKGGSLSLTCELLAAAMVGAPVQDGPTKNTAIVNSMFSVLVDPARLGTAAAFGEELESVLDWAKSENAAGGTVRLPGEPEEEARRTRARDGIAVDPETLAQLRTAAVSLGLDPATPF